MKVKLFLFMLCYIFILTGCNINEKATEINPSVTADNDTVDVDVEFDMDSNESLVSSANIIQNSGDGDNLINSPNEEIVYESNNINTYDNVEQNTTSIQSQNINVYIDKVLTDLTDLNGNSVYPLVSEGEIYVPISSLGEILNTHVEWDRINKSVYIGKTPNGTNNMLDIIHGYDPQDFVEYSFMENKGTEHFAMAGKDYTDGAVFIMPYSINSVSSVNFNLEGKYNTLRFKLGHYDGADMNPITLIIKLDGYVNEEIEMNAEDYPQNYEIDVTNVMQLRFEMSGKNTQYAMTNMELF